jgi:hypothetical protein
MIDYKITSNIKDFEYHLDDVAKKQVPFAASKAINATLLDARKSVIKHLQATQRSKRSWWNNRETGLLRTFANKKNLIGSLFTKIYWAKLQEEGGIKTPRHKVLAIPTERTPNSRRRAGGAKTMLAGQKVFSIAKGIFRRVGGKKSRRVELLFSYEPKAVIDKPMLKLREISGKVARRKFWGHFADEFKKAMKTARR